MPLCVDERKSIESRFNAAVTERMDEAGKHKSKPLLNSNLKLIGYRALHHGASVSQRFVNDRLAAVRQFPGV